MSTSVAPSLTVASAAGPSHSPTQSFFEDPLHLRTILVPVDFSDTSLRALEFAAPLAQRFGAAIHLVYVFDGHHQFTGISNAHFLLSDTQIVLLLKKEVQRKYPFSLGEENCHVRCGKAFQEIADVAHEIKADLVVMTTHGYGGWKHLTLGSTAERVVQHADCPVLVVRDGTRAPIKNAQEGIVLEKILVPVDFSECAQEGAKYASVFATGVGASLLLAHIIHPPDYTGAGGYAGGVDWAPLSDRTLAEAEDFLDELVNSLPLTNIAAETTVEFGVPIYNLVDLTERSDIDLVITSTHGFTGLRHALIGSTAEYLVRCAHCPVLVVPSHRRRA